MIFLFFIEKFTCYINDENDNLNVTIAINGSTQLNQVYYTPDEKMIFCIQVSIS